LAGLDRKPGFAAVPKDGREPVLRDRINTSSSDVTRPRLKKNKRQS
jgi:hypothetical protein